MEMQHLHAAERKDPMTDAAFFIFQARQTSATDGEGGNSKQRMT